MDDLPNPIHDCAERLFEELFDRHGFFKMRRNDVNFPAMFILVYGKRSRIRMKDIAEWFDVTNSTATQYVDELEKDGYVRRVRSREDRREVYVEVTAKGKKWIEKEKSISMKFLDERMANLTPEEQRQFASLWLKFMGQGENTDCT